MLAHSQAIYSQFATHNAYSVAAIVQLAGNTQFEFQCLHGMGEVLYRQITENAEYNIACRIYAPVGPHKDLLAYLVRRLLENGANSSFVNRLSDSKLPIESIIAAPDESLRELNSFRHNNITLPANLYGHTRTNAQGTDPTEVTLFETLQPALHSLQDRTPLCTPTTENPTSINGEKIAITNPADKTEQVGEVINANESDAEVALQTASRFSKKWDGTPANQRGSTLVKAAELMEAQRDYLIALCIKEAGENSA